ncbi:hypothetical protein BGZ99_004555 [Dissophora globulifera]|uniref:orotate phosphoribosyltransferase n=1 Tax=Dissophora globulifera TaxID=979702 RepID=A0A9P6RLE9_9FUNG|nr:hypothetical protein BGZ99_004555 [Dissophora globulifera]
MTIKQYQRDFIDFAIANEVLKFGEFTLKSGRISPYFFNAGLFNTGAALAKIGRFYAATISDWTDANYDMIFGPAYKGIPLACATAIAMAEFHGKNIPYCFNRKEKKDHGEGGTIVGAPLSGSVLIIDDVITAGTAIRESIAIIDSCKALTAGVVVAIDRQETGKDGVQSAIQEVESQANMKVRAIVTMAQIMEYMEEKGNYTEELSKMRAYREKYGVKSE